jgi:hypothetical protein
MVHWRWQSVESVPPIRMRRALTMSCATKASVTLFIASTLLATTAPACRPPAAVTPPAAATAEKSVNAVSVRIHEETSAKDSTQVRTGTPASVVARFEPVQFRLLRRSDGSISGTNSSPWDPHTVAEMQVCTSLDDPCELTGEWVSFASDQEYAVDVDWVGPRSFWVVAQFRDAAGTLIPSVGKSYQGPEDRVQDSIELIGVPDKAIPLPAQPPVVQTAVVATHEAFPVRGSVEIEGGQCCVGGTEGDTIDVRAAFEASGPTAKVTEMRVSKGCPTEDEMADVPWEPFVSERTYPVQVFINWTGFDIGVQYRDAQGNLSPVYCDDIAVEGHPAPSK